MAAPHVSGAIALFIEYYRNSPNTPGDPSPAMMKAAFLPVATGDFVAGLISAVVWIGVASVLAQRAFRRFVIQKEGVR